jgi:nitrogen fixation NifU-like protein
MGSIFVSLAGQYLTIPFDNGRYHHSHICHDKGGMYPELLLEHFRNPRNVGDLEPPAIAVEAMNPICGDILRLSARFENDSVVEVRYRTRGCTASIAAGSALTEWMVGKSRAQLAALTPDAISEAVGGLQPESRHAGVLCVDAVKALLKRSGV